MHVHSHMPFLQPQIAPRPLKREPPSDEAYEIRRIFEQSDEQRSKNSRQHPRRDGGSFEQKTVFDLDSATADGPTRSHEEAAVALSSGAAARQQLWSLLGTVASTAPQRQPSRPTVAEPELSLDALLAQIVKSA